MKAWSERVAGWRVVHRLRAWTGLVLMAYTTTHLVNHAMGLISLETLDRAQRLVAPVWYDGPGEALLLASLFVHMVLAFWLIARSATLRLPCWQLAQLALGLAATLVLAEHVAATAQIEGVMNANVDYFLVLRAIWPEQALAYVLMLVAVWLHGCLGLHYWWRLQRWYVRAQPLLLTIALVLPALAVGGFLAAGRDVAHRAPAAAQAWAIERRWPDFSQAEGLVGRAETALLVFVFGGVTLALVGRGVRALVRRRRTVRLTYPSGHKVRAAAGLTLLEMSREASIPHAAVCGGRARCSTCRVRVTHGLDTLTSPGPAEARLLNRLGHPEGVRLACQIRPTAPLTVVPLVAPPTALRDVRSDADPGLGRERELAVLFCDIRGFTQLSEDRLPYDVVYILNQYFRAMGEAIDAAGGQIDKVIGDGIMALFGVTGDGASAARGALTAAAAMAERLELLNASLADELAQPLRLAIGAHLGPAVVGEMGHGASRQLTAIGDTVNVASRLETLAKGADAQLVVSDALLRRAGIAATPVEAPLPGRSETLAVHYYGDARAVPQTTA